MSSNKSDGASDKLPIEIESSNIYNYKLIITVLADGSDHYRCEKPGTNCSVGANGEISIRKPTLEADRLIVAINNGTVSDYVNSAEFEAIFPGLTNSDLSNKLIAGELTIKLAPTKDKDVMFVITKPDVTSFNTENIILASVLENYYQ